MGRRSALVLLAILASAVPAQVARADGDPASDVLLGLNVFYPYSPPVSAALQKTLDAETAAASRADFPIKVALIQSPVDLGAIQTLFDKPKQYADYLDQELSFGHKQPLLVVMPNGYGVQGLPPAATTAAGSLPTPTGTGSDDLARAAITAVRALAAAAGHLIRAYENPPTGAGHSHRSAALVLIVLALAAITVAGTLILIRTRTQWPVWSDRARSRTKRPYQVRRRTAPRAAVADRTRAEVVQPRLAVGLVLIEVGAGWALLRGLDFYGLTPIDLGYDLDQPPLLLLLVGAWLIYRSRSHPHSR
jgi:hypothetical protein